MNFLGLLSKLNASQHSIQKVASFAMRHRSLHEDLYNCIIEALDQVTIFLSFFLLCRHCTFPQPHTPKHFLFSHGPLELKEQGMNNKDKGLSIINTTLGRQQHPPYRTLLFTRKGTFQLTGRIGSQLRIRQQRSLARLCMPDRVLLKPRVKSLEGAYDRHFNQERSFARFSLRSLSHLFCLIDMTSIAFSLSFFSPCSRE